MWISDDGKYKIEITEVTCQDKRFGELTIPQYVAYRWVEENERWDRVIATANINILAHHIDLTTILEFPPPDWEVDAMEATHE